MTAELPWIAINAATTMMAHCRNNEGFEYMKRALTQKEVRHLLEERRAIHDQPAPPTNTLATQSDLVDHERAYLAVTILFLSEISEANWSFLHPFIVLPPQGNADHHVLSVCAIGVMNMGIACHRDAYQAKTCAARRRLFQRARSLYMRAEDLLLDDASDVHPDDSLFQAFLTIYTNLIEIDMELGNYHDVQNWLQDLDGCVDCIAPWDDSPVFCHFCQARLFYRDGMITASTA